MCIGIPMQVIEASEGRATCEGLGQRRDVDMILVGEQPPGTWVLVFLEAAREVLSEEDATRIGNAVRAVAQVMDNPGTSPRQDDFDLLFADLVNREPPKPPSLLALEQSRKNNGA